MESRRLSIRVPDPLLNRFESHLDQQGLTVTEGVLVAHRVADLCEIASYVGDNERLPLVERVSRLEKKLALNVATRNNKRVRPESSVFWDQIKCNYPVR